MTPAMRSAIVIASKGRPAVLEETLASLLQLEGSPRIVVVVTSAADLPAGRPGHPRIQTLMGHEGATFQRNAGIAALDLDALDAVVFFDDDVEVHPAYLTRVGTLLAARPDIVAGSGHMLRDGNVTREDARAEIARWRADGSDAFRAEGRHSTLYGCNMFIRAAALKHTRFDENLPSFAFAEDYEISIRLRRIGLVGRFNNAVAVHLKWPGGRVNLRRVSYAMIANNLYFLRKGSVPPPRSVAVLRFLYLALVRVPLIEFAQRCRHTDWRAKLAWWDGCGRAWLDMLTGRCQPSRILDL